MIIVNAQALAFRFFCSVVAVCITAYMIMTRDNQDKE